MANAAAGKLRTPALNYPQALKTAQAKKTYKHQLLKENPECLLADSSQSGPKITVTNLLLHTDHRDTWHRAICAYYKQHRKRGICNGRQITIDSEDGDASFLTVNVYHNGTIMSQGSEASPSSVQQDFTFIRALTEAETERGPSPRSTKITIAIILSRTDIHPATIQKINEEISRGCELMANVHLAHHPNLSIHSLHDHIHLHKDVVNTFAKNLKDVALDCSPNSPPRSNRAPSLHTARLLYPSPPREISTHQATHHYRPLSQPQQHNYSTSRATNQTTPLHRYPRLSPMPRPPSTSKLRPPPLPSPVHQAPLPSQVHRKPVPSPSRQLLQQTYASAVQTPAPTSTTDLSEIKQLLSLSRLLS
ncbi:hypothetical protein AOLI_G00089490 [Acnodon oligacanthus]